MKFLKGLGRCLGRLFVWLVVIVALVVVVLFVRPQAVHKATEKIAALANLASELFPPQLPPATTIGRVLWTEQNWSAGARYWFHHTPQGTATFPVPYDWLVELERPELWLFSNRPLLRDETYLRRFGFIPSTRLARSQATETPDYPYPDENSDGLPVGFAKMPAGPDPTTGEQMPAQIGFTCAACHTGHIEYKNVSIRFDGGPAMVNLGALEKAIGLSIVYTLNIPFRFDRFADRLEERIRKEQKTPIQIDRKKLREDMELVLARISLKVGWEGQILQQGKTQHTDEGFGRLDALNRIGNQVFFEDMLVFEKSEPVTPKWAIWRKAKQKKQPVPDHLVGNFAPHDAPVSFPPIWDVPWFLWAQYDASIFNEMVRNAGEALGVGAKVNMTNNQRPWFTSSMPLENISKFEELLRGPDPFAVKSGERPAFKGLVSPKWREVAKLLNDDPAWRINETNVSKGRELYKEHCVECHRGPVNDAEFDNKYPELSFWSETRPDVPEGAKPEDKQNWIAINGTKYFNVVQKRVADMGTDRQQADVLAERSVHIPKELQVDPIKQLNERWKECKIPEDAALNRSFALSLMAVVEKTIDRWFVDHPDKAAMKDKMWGPRPNCPNPRSIAALPRPGSSNPDIIPIRIYRARPLDGVWATAPYLHNGSVPTLMDMLRPQNERPKTFCVGSRQFDPGNVGLDQATCPPGATKFDASELGNSNLGHSFEGKVTDKKKLPPGVIGPELSTDDRSALVEYLKTL
jgi:hypothetical protein